MTHSVETHFPPAVYRLPQLKCLGGAVYWGVLKSWGLWDTRRPSFTHILLCCLSPELNFKRAKCKVFLNDTKVQPTTHSLELTFFPLQNETTILWTETIERHFIFFCVPQNKVSHTGLKWHEGKWMTKFQFFLVSIDVNYKDGEQKKKRDDISLGHHFQFQPPCPELFPLTSLSSQECLSISPMAYK